MSLSNSSQSPGERELCPSLEPPAGSDSRQRFAMQLVRLPAAVGGRRSPCARGQRGAAPCPVVAAGRCCAAAVFADAASAEQALLSMRLRGRGAGASAEQEAEVAACVAFLENDGGVSAPAESPLVEGDWTLLYTSKSRFDVRNPLGARVDGSAPGLEAVFRLFGGSADASAAAASSSPIQRSITGNDAFTVTQTVALRAAEPMVDNTVCFGASGKLLLRAAACVSESADRRRIDFRFDGGYFETADLPVVGRVRIPYPVPFKLLGDEAKGWLDTTYLSARVRISRGNKGTTFILCKDDPGKDE